MKNVGRLKNAFTIERGDDFHCELQRRCPVADERNSLVDAGDGLVCSLLRPRECSDFVCDVHDDSLRAWLNSSTITEAGAVTNRLGGGPA